jgi:hypothetical protein
VHRQIVLESVDQRPRAADLHANAWYLEQVRALVFLTTTAEGWVHLARIVVVNVLKVPVRLVFLQCVCSSRFNQLGYVMSLEKCGYNATEQE